MKKYMIAICTLFFVSYMKADSLDLSPSNLVIRELQQSDFDKIKQLFANNSDISYQTSIKSSDIISYFGSTSIKVYVCFDLLSEKVVAFVVAYASGQSFYVRALGVDKDYRRFGIATKLLKQVYGFASGQNIYKMLTIHASNEKAKKCYEKFGFKYNNLTCSLALAI